MSKDFSALRLNLRKLPGATGKLGLLEPLLSESQRHTHLAFLLGTVIAWGLWAAWWSGVHAFSWRNFTVFDRVLTVLVCYECYESLYAMLMLLRAKVPVPLPLTSSPTRPSAAAAAAANSPLNSFRDVELASEEEEEGSEGERSGLLALRRSASSAITLVTMTMQLQSPPPADPGSDVEASPQSFTGLDCDNGDSASISPVTCRSTASVSDADIVEGGAATGTDSDPTNDVTPHSPSSSPSSSSPVTLPLAPSVAARSLPKVHPLSLRVAMVVTKAPSEPESMLMTTLSACLAQQWPGRYDVWIADEDPTPAMESWCKENGVRISCRKGVEGYHNVDWPRRRRCKEGNLAYFYDKFGYANYDVVCQFDADHVPSCSYLANTIPIYADPTVGYVACPSICGANAEESWAVRGRLYLESYMHGPLGASRSAGALPACIGSHYSVRTSALKDIGGIGPELDEDYSTSMIMTSHGWKGVFSINTIAHGDGPQCFEDAMRQEYQWARSAMIILVNYTWRYWRLPHMTPLERFHVIFFNWHWLWQSTLAVLGFVMSVAPALGAPPGPFLWRQWAAAMGLPYSLIVTHWLWVRRQGWLRPVNAQILSWERMLHKACMPYFIAIGCVHGLLGAWLGLSFDIKVTPKGEGGQRLLGVRNLAPMLLAACGACAVLLAVEGSSRLPLLVAYPIIQLVIVTAVTGLHYWEQSRPFWGPGSRFPVRNAVKLGAVLLGLTSLVVTSCCRDALGLPGLMALPDAAEPLQAA